MLGVLYIVLCFIIGSFFVNYCFRNLKNLTVVRKADGSEIRLPEFYVVFPACYASGTLFLTWLVYIFAYLFRNTGKGMLYGNIVVFSLAIVGILVYYLLKGRKTSKKQWLCNFINMFINCNKSFLVLAGIAFLFCVIIMYKTLYVKDGQYVVATSVSADFGCHLGMIRSFSYGNNFPTGYTVYGGEDVKYHFMHTFLVGNLEFLGLRLDHAFNIPSILSLFSVYTLLATLCANLFKSRLTVWLSALFFTFRSSPSVFRFLAEDRSENHFKALLEAGRYFDYSSTQEAWGFWCTRVFTNQRHLAFGMTVLMLMILIFLPYLNEMGEKLLGLKNPPEIIGEEEAETKKIGFFGTCRVYLQTLFFNREAFAFKDIRTAIGAGLLLGALSFWHGSMVIGALAILFFMAAFSNRRLDYVVVAAFTVALSLFQTHAFINGSAVAFHFEFGFLADNRTPWGVLAYIFALSGVTILIALFEMLNSKGVTRYMFLPLSLPFIMSFCIGLTSDIGVNHKWIILSLMFISMYTANFVARFLRDRDVVKYIFMIPLIIMLTGTGVYELYRQYREDDGYNFRYDMDDPLVDWLRENVTSQDLVLFHKYPITRPLMAGIMNYYGYDYAAVSAGYRDYYYDNNPRLGYIKKFFTASTPNKMAYYAARYNIDFVIVDAGLRETDYDGIYVNEDMLEQTFEEVYTTYSKDMSEDEKRWTIRVFDTSKTIYDK